MLLTIAGCGHPVPATPSPASSNCVVVDDAARPRITLAVRGRIAAADAPASTAARIVSAQLHETLVRIDCTDAVVAGLASEWSTGDGLAWRFRIARGATFTDGTPVTAQSIIAAWSAARTSSFSAVTAAGEYDLHVTLHTKADERLFALPALAVARQAGAWPTGSGAYTPDPLVEVGVLRLLARAPDARTADTIDVRTFGSDARTALDARADALVTGDAATLAYARARSDYATVPLPWNRTHVLLTPGLRDSVSAPAADAMDALRDAVRAEARAALPPFWWQYCRYEPADQATPRRSTPGGIVYPRGDEVAREIAERIAALAWPRESAPAWLHGLLPSGYSVPRAAAVDESGLRAAIRSSSALAVIAPVARVSYTGCDPSTAGAYDAVDDALRTASWHATPLLDTRDYLIHRPGIGRVTVDGDGTIRFGSR